MRPGVPVARDLLAAARRDGPTEAQRSRIWEQVSLAPHLVVVAPLAAGAAPKSIAPVAKAVGMGLSAGKMLIAGALAGSALTVGLGFVLLRAPLLPHAAVHEEAAATFPATVNRAPTPAADGPASPAEIDDVSVAAPAPASETAGAPAPLAVATSRAASAPHATVHARRGAVPPVGAGDEPSDDALLHEAALVSQARTAIVQGRPADALDALDVAARGRTHSMEPEELSLRVRALRLMGRNAEAARAVGELRTRYPDSPLLAH